MLHSPPDSAFAQHVAKWVFDVASLSAVPLLIKAVDNDRSITLLIELSQLRSRKRLMNAVDNAKTPTPIPELKPKPCNLNPKP
jgi:hypothetical protein